MIGDLFNLILVDPMTNVLVALARLFAGNFGIAIIMFTLLMKAVTWPLTASQFKQSRAMQAMQPKMQELQKKYKGQDPKKLQAETMALYKEAGVNPLGCLLPMVVQMPIWIALYQVINRSLGEAPENLVGLSQRLYPIPYVHEAVPLNNHLLYWDLGQPDASLILPVIVAFSMYVQQKMITPAPTAATANSQQQQTAQMMAWMMPLMFGFWSLSVPAGLALYWAVSNISGLVIQYFYMGRRVDWSTLWKLSPAPAPAAGARPARSTPQREPARLPRPQPAAPADGDEVADEVATVQPGIAGPSRRKRHGKRRGKR